MKIFYKTFDLEYAIIFLSEEMRYFGIAVCGGKKKVNKLTGSLPLLK